MTSSPVHTVTRMDSVTEITEVKVQATLHFISLDFETRKGPLFQALSSGMEQDWGSYQFPFLQCLFPPSLSLSLSPSLSPPLSPSLPLSLPPPPPLSPSLSPSSLSLSLSLSPLFSSSGMMAQVNVYKNMVNVKGRYAHYSLMPQATNHMSV